MDHGDGVNRDVNGRAYPDPARPTPQRVLNEAWPFKDTAGPHARGLDDKDAGEQRQVHVRLEFVVDGEVWLNGRATRWTDEFSHVFVVVDDPRLKPGFVWVRARDTKIALTTRQGESSGPRPHHTAP